MLAGCVHTGVVDQDVKAAECLDGLIEHALDRLLVADVRLHRVCLPAARFDSARRLLGARPVVEIVNHDIRTLGPEDGCGSPSDP